MSLTLRLVQHSSKLALLLAVLWLWFGGLGALCLWGLKVQYEASYKAYRKAQVLESKNVVYFENAPEDGEFWHKGKLYDAFSTEDGKSLAYRDYGEEVAVTLFGAKSFWPEGHHAWDWTALSEILVKYKATIPEFIPENRFLEKKKNAKFFAFNQKVEGKKIRPPAPVPLYLCS